MLGGFNWVVGWFDNLGLVWVVLDLGLVLVVLDMGLVGFSLGGFRLGRGGWF